MIVKAIIFGTDDLFPKLQPKYEEQVKQGNLEIIGYVDATKDDLKFFATPDFKEGTELENVTFNAIILSTQDNLYSRIKFLESKGLSRRTMIDGKIFDVEGLDFLHLLKEGIAQGTVSADDITMNIRSPFYRRFATAGDKVKIFTGRCSAIDKSRVVADTQTEIVVGNFSEIADGQVFEICLNARRKYRNVAASNNFAWKVTQNNSDEVCRIIFGNDVSVGRGCRFKSANPAQPLVIGDGAVIESDSVITASIPPYAIVGGNPARIIRYRFSDKIIAALLRIKWWNWDIDKIHDNFKFYTDIEKFVAENDIAPQPVPQPKPAPKPAAKPKAAPKPKPAVKIEQTKPENRFQLDLSQLKFV